MRSKIQGIAILAAMVLFIWAYRIGYGEETAQWRIQIQIPSCTMTVFRDETEWKRYPVAVGKPATPTPEGVFEVITKVKNPTWFPPKRQAVPPGPHNPLGRYWMGLDRGGYGIHGNNNPTSIGHHVTNGCIRMRNQDIDELFGVLPSGTSVVISYDLYEVVPGEGDRFYLRAYSDVYNRHPDPAEMIQKSLDWNAPGYPAHLKGLLWLLGSKRPAEVEIPRRVKISLDDSLYPEEAFVCGDKLFLSGKILELWGQTGPEYIGAEDLIKDHGIQVSQESEDKVGIRTIH